MKVDKIGFAAFGALAVFASFAGERWQAEREEWKSFCKTFEPDYSDGGKYLLPKEGNRFDEPFQLVRGGKPAARIVWHRGGFYTDRFSSKVTERAAKELQALVKMLTGVTLPVYDNENAGTELPAVMLGKGTFYPFDETRECRHPKSAFKRILPGMVKQLRADLAAMRGTDGFAIRKFGCDIYVYGANERGTLNGVYRLIENNSDLIFVRPSEQIGVVHGPEKGDFALVWGRDVLERPVLSGRGFWNMRHARYWNANYGTTTDSDEWTDERRHTFGSHNSGHFVPPLSERPDLHGLVSGKRGEYGFMQCFSHPDMPKVFSERVVSHYDLRAPRELGGVKIALDDTMNWCSCENCQRPIALDDGTVVGKDDPAFKSTQFFRILNASADALAAAYPGATVLTLGYFQTAEPPKCPVSPNIVVGYCPYMRANDMAPVFMPENEIWIDRLERWAKKVPDRRHLYLRGYDGLGLSFPRPLCHVHQRDWRLYQKHLSWMNHENPAQLWDRTEKDGTPSKASVIFDYSAIEFWVMSRLMWNVEEDVEGLYKQFCYRAYREAAKPMERFYGTIRRDWMRSGRMSTIGEDGLNATKIFIIDSGREQELRGYLEEALKAVRHPVSKELIGRVKGRFEHFISEVKNAKTSSLNVPQVVAAKDPSFDDADWKSAAAIEKLYDPGKAAKGEDVEGRYPAKIELQHDGRNLFFRATMWEDMKTISTTPPVAGKEDVNGSKLEVFFGDNSNEGQYLLFRVDNAGGYSDYRGYDGSWNRKATTFAVRKYDDRWVVVMKLPLEELGMNLIADNHLKAAFIRVRESIAEPGNTEYTSWKFSNFHRLSTFGTLTLQR